MNDLPRSLRLRSRERIGEIFREGGRARAGVVGARAMPHPDGTRLAVVAGKAMGGAVVRNRLKRRLRAAMRQQHGAMPPGWDVVLMARPGLLEAKWADVMRDVATAMERVTGASPGRRPPPPIQ